MQCHAEMKSKKAEVEKGDDADSVALLNSGAGAGAGMAGAWSRRARWVLALAALLAYLLLFSYLKAQYRQVRRLNRLLAIEKDTDELLKNLEELDGHLRLKLDRLDALPTL